MWELTRKAKPPEDCKPGGPATWASPRCKLRPGLCGAAAPALAANPEADSWWLDLPPPPPREAPPHRL